MPMIDVCRGGKEKIIFYIWNIFYDKSHARLTALKKKNKFLQLFNCIPERGI